MTQRSLAFLPGMRAKADYAVAPLVAGLSQLTGLLQLVLLTRAGGAGHASDAYFFLFSMAFLPVQVLLAGLLYPLLLNPSRPNERTLARLKRFTPWSCVLMVLVAAAWLSHTGTLSPSLYVLVGLSGVNGFISAVVWYHCLHLTADGAAIWLAGVALPANVGACLLIAHAWVPSSLRATLMVGGLVIGNLFLLTYLKRSGRTKSAAGGHPLAGPPTPRAGGWFLTKSVTGYASQDVFEGLALLLPATSLTILNILNRVVGSLSTALVSSVLPKLVHRGTASRNQAVSFARWIAALLAVPFCVVGVLSLFVALPYQEYVLATLAWLLASGLNASAQRLAYRFLPASASVLSIVSAVLVVGVVVAISATTLFSLRTLFVGAIALDALPAAFLFLTLSERALSGVTALVFVGATTLLMAGHT